MRALEYEMKGTSRRHELKQTTAVSNLCFSADEPLFAAALALSHNVSSLCWSLRAVAECLTRTSPTRPRSRPRRTSCREKRARPSSGWAATRRKTSRGGCGECAFSGAMDVVRPNVCINIDCNRPVKAERPLHLCERSWIRCRACSCGVMLSRTNGSIETGGTHRGRTG